MQLQSKGTNIPLLHGGLFVCHPAAGYSTFPIVTATQGQWFSSVSAQDPLQRMTVWGGRPPK